MDDTMNTIVHQLTVYVRYSGTCLHASLRLQYISDTLGHNSVCNYNEL